MKMLVVNPVGRFSAKQLLSDPFMRHTTLRAEGSMQSDLFLSTNESSNVISQTLAANQQNMNNRINSKKNSAVDGWKNFENKIMININGTSGEKMDILQNNPVPTVTSFQSERSGLMTS